jgi:hypothetical protein
MLNNKPMISRAHKFALAATLLLLPLAGYSAPPKTTPPHDTNAAPHVIIQSTFITPAAPIEGRDPFFPNATSLYRTAIVTNKPVQETGASLKLKSLLGTSLAQINNMTLAVGETEEVKTESGPVSVRLIEIRADQSVVIEANGQRRILGFGK